MRVYRLILQENPGDSKDTSISRRGKNFLSQVARAAIRTGVSP